MFDRVSVVGAGRVGLSIARALARTGTEVLVLSRQSRALPAPLHPATSDLNSAVALAKLVVIAVPDDALTSVSHALARATSVTAEHVFLHTSGMHDRSALLPLAGSGAALGSWHPLQTFSHAGGEPATLAGSPAVIEGDDRALAAGRWLADLLHLRPVVELSAEHKAKYHAGAVFASNYLVVLADIAAHLGHEAGAGDAATALFLPLMRRTLANYSAGGNDTLTGPIRRGDAGTVARHLAVLQGAERELYLLLGREALRLSIAGGLEPSRAAEIRALLY